MRIHGRVAVGMLLLLALAGCTTSAVTTLTSPSARPRGDGVLRIGTLFPMTGSLAFLGPAQQAGAAAAVSDINSAGGVGGRPVQLVPVDSGESEADAAAAFPKLIAQGVDAVIGPASSSVVLAVLPAAARAGVPMISPAATFPGLTTSADAPYFFRTIPEYSLQSGALALAIDPASRSRVALVYSDDGLANTLAKTLPRQLRAIRGTVVASIAVPAGETAFDSVTSALTNAAPDVVVLATEGGATPQAIALIAALTAAGFGHEHLWFTTQNLADYSEALPAGTLTGASGVLEGAASDDAFIQKLLKQNGGLTSYHYAAEAYDATMLAALAAVSAKDDAGTSIAGAIRSVSEGGTACTTFATCAAALAAHRDIDYQGVSGAVDLTATGNIASGWYGVYRYGADNNYSLISTVLAK